MKLKRLEIQGFKSFAEKTEIVFEAGTTAIVGPNGSGKSNISDAVRWVLGEQSAKQLRGGKMEDVIFGGTEKRKAHSWCEVSLLFDNEDRGLSMDCAEVLVTRRVWRNGDSEYYLNKAACRLKDISDLFRDTGIGKDGYSLIGQGRIDAILATKSEERREVFEEAAGIVTYRARKEEAERRMANTRQNLDRVEDILSELEGQIEPLREQSETARRYIELRESLRGLELNAFLIHHDRLKKSIDDYEALILSLDFDIAKTEPRIDALSAERDALSEAVDRINEEEAGLNAKVLEAARAVEAREGANNVLRERISHQEADARREAALALEDAGRAEALEALRAENASDEAARAKALEEAREALEAIEAQVASAHREAAGSEEALESHKAAIMQAMNRVTDMKAAQARLSGLRQSLTTRLSDAEKQAASFGDKGPELDEALGAAAAALSAAKADMQALESEARRLDETVRAAGQESEALLASLREKTGKKHEADSRLSVLREMERDYEGYQHAVRQALLYARGDASVRGVVANLIKSPEEYERALEMVLGSALQQIVTADEHAAKRLIEYLRVNRFGRATFLPMTTVRGRTLSQGERQVLSMPGCIGVASELVSFDHEYRDIVENLLGRTIIADNLDHGIAIMRRGQHAFRLVTLDGDVMHSGGSMTGGSVQSRMTSLLSREREIEEHVRLVKTLGDEIAAAQRKIETLDRERAEAKRQRNELYDRAHQAEIAVARETEHEANARAAQRAHNERREQAELYVEQIRENLSDIENQLARADADHEGGELDQADMQARTAAMQAALSEARARLDALHQDETRARVAFASQERELEAVRREGERLLREETQLSRGKDRREEDLKAARDALVRDRQELQNGEAEHAARAEALETARAEHLCCAASRQSLIAKSREITASLETARAQITTAGEKRHRTELSLVRVQNDLKALRDRIWSEWELTYAGALPFRQEPFDLKESEKQIAAYRAEIRQMGTVNVNAVENYRLTKERFDQLDAQRNDLVKAAADLTDIIEELTTKMERKFRKQFAQLNEFFGDTFNMLFGGGHAELKLVDESDVLGCGIEVIAQPPGKKLQLLTLLSGGERALTAIAILFAMLKLKPTPFCILDEIEAALDEANVANFAEFLNDFAKSTQFVVVTHRRGTMERCQALYGVAMEEKGVSRMVSVRLTEGA